MYTHAPNVRNVPDPPIACVFTPVRPVDPRDGGRKIIMALTIPGAFGESLVGGSPRDYNLQLQLQLRDRSHRFLAPRNPHLEIIFERRAFHRPRRKKTGGRRDSSRPWAWRRLRPMWPRRTSVKPAGPTRTSAAPKRERSTHRLFRRTKALVLLLISKRGPFPTAACSCISASALPHALVLWIQAN
jgi:hypothetical protein